MNSYFESLGRFATHNPNKIALSFHQDGASTVVRYGELWRDIDREAVSARASRRGELEIISSRTGYGTILTYLSALRNGAYPAYLAPLTARQDAQIFHSELSQLIERFRPNRVIADTFDPARLHSLPFGDVDEPGLVQFSSGTTGLRKGIFISERHLLAQLAALGTQLGINAEDRIACWLPLYHDMGLISSLLLPLYFGASVAYLDPVEWSFRPESLLALVHSERTTVCWQPDFAFRHIANRYARAGVLPESRLDSLRLLINCSEPCRTRTFVDFWHRFRGLGLREDALQVSYGMAEIVFAATVTAFNSEREWLSDPEYLSSGRPLPGTAARIADGGSAEQPGEIEVQGECLFAGYLRHPDPREVFSGGWFRTGDLGFVRERELYVVGRKDDTLIVNGRKILAYQVEDHVGLQKGVRPGRVLCIVSTGGTAVDILYEGEELDVENLRRIRQWCATAAGASVNRILNLEPGIIVKSSSGKVARAKSIEKLARLGLLGS
ncbi:MAG: AMP-binding protein [Gammaproteobacteria bacterium]